MATSPDRGGPVPVVVAGAGPAGLVAAATLACRGVGVLLVERNPGLSPLPRATGVGVRTLELLRSWGLEDYSDERLASLVRTAAGADLPVRGVAEGAFSFAAHSRKRPSAAWLTARATIRGERTSVL